MTNPGNNSALSNTSMVESSENYRLLIVDDDPQQVEMVQEFLRLSGFSDVDVAENLQTLWDQLERQSYDLVLLDYLLSNENGLDALDRFATRGIPVPVVMITGQGDERVAAQAIQRGAVDYIVKTPDYLLTLPAVIRKSVRAYQLQLSVQRSLEQIRYQATLLNNVRDAVVVWDLEGRITFWNPAATGLFGWSSDERLGCQVEECYLSAFNPPIHLPKEGDTVGHYVERQIHTKNNTRIWVSSRISALRDAARDNRLIGYMNISHDITKRKEAEQALRAERNFVSAVLEVIGALVIVFDRQGRVVRFNRACEQVTGYPFAEVRGQKVWDLFIPPEDRETIQSLFGQLAEGIFPKEHENVWLTRAGERRLIAWSNTVLTNRLGRVDYVIATGIDITERRQAEEAMLRAQGQLVQAARLATIGEMASGVAHQINNPLTTIIADAQILLRQLQSNHPGRDSAEAIEKAGWRLQQVVQQLMEFSRPGSGDLEDLDLCDTIRSALLLVGAHIESAGIQLQTDLPNGLPHLHGSRRQLEDLWVNLLLLARDALQNRANGKILIQAYPGDGGEAVVQVRDNGEPIPNELLQTIFEPNFTGTTINRGTGMELSICREIVRQHNGQILAECTPERETIFTIQLPSSRTQETGVVSTHRTART